MLDLVAKNGMHFEENYFTRSSWKDNCALFLSSDFSTKKKAAEFWDFCVAPSGFNVKLGKKRETGGLDSLLQCKPGLLASFVRVC